MSGVLFASSKVQGATAAAQTISNRNSATCMRSQVDYLKQLLCTPQACTFLSPKTLDYGTQTFRVHTPPLYTTHPCSWQKCQIIALLSTGSECTLTTTIFLNSSCGAKVPAEEKKPCRKQSSQQSGGEGLALILSLLSCVLEIQCLKILQYHDHHTIFCELHHRQSIQNSKISSFPQNSELT